MSRRCRLITLESQLTRRQHADSTPTLERVLRLVYTTMLDAELTLPQVAVLLDYNEKEIRNKLIAKIENALIRRKWQTLPIARTLFSRFILPTARTAIKSSISFTRRTGKRASAKKLNRKLRAHFHYVVKQKKHIADYGVKRIRAVLVESVENYWTNQLRLHARHPAVSGSKLSLLFWFTTSDVVFERKTNVRI